ncbi:MAG: glycosyltransferase, partial [Candidatus Thorarchaeota archaeon]
MMDITPALHVKNEEYWIHYVLRGLLKVFDRVVMIDTGSNDRTVEIAKATAEQVGGDLVLTVDDMGDDNFRIGHAPNVLIESIDTEWMLLVDGDEIWGQSQLEALLDIEPQGGWLVGMCNGRNLMDADGTLMEREGFSA